MRGNIRRRGDTWTYQFYIGTVDGKKRYKSKGGFKTRTMASRALNKALYEYESTGYVETGNILFSTFAYRWLEEYIKPNRKITTYNRYSELLKIYVIPALGRLEITKINIEDIERMISSRPDVSCSTLQSIYTLANTILKRAMKLGLINKNPCTLVERPKRDKYQSEALTADEIVAIFNFLELDEERDYIFYIALRIVLECGLRRGELAGLEWSNIDFKNHIIEVRNNMVYSNGRIYILTPKTPESIRRLVISENLVELLREYKKRQMEYATMLKGFYRENVYDGQEYNFVMRWYNGAKVHPMYYTNRLPKLLKKCGIERHIRFHDTRVTNATLLAIKHISPKTVQARLGHTNINTTMNIYTHATNEMQEEAVKKLDEILGMSKECQKEKH